MRKGYLEPSFYLLFSAGLLILLSLPFLSDWSLGMWVTAKLLYVAGVVFFVVNR